MRFRRVVVLALAAVALAAACFPDSTGPRLLARAALAVLPTWANPLSAGAPVARARIIARRADGSVAKDTVVTFPAGADSLVVSLDVPLAGGGAGGSEPFGVAFKLIGPAGDTIFTGGPVPVTGYAPGRAPAGQVAVTVPTIYVGPGKNAQSINVIVRDTSVAFGDSITLTALARDSAGAPLPGTLIAWTSTDTTRLTVTDKFGGTLKGGTRRGLVKALARTLTGQADTVNVTVQPVASAVFSLGGNGQSGAAGSRLLPFRIKVIAPDSLGVRGVAVAWSIVSGGGTLSSATVFTDSGGVAADTLTLPTVPGPVSVRATVAGLAGSPVTFLATAVPGVPTRLVFTVNPPAVSLAGQGLVPTVTVTEQDALGNVVTTATDSIVLAIGANPGSSALSGVVRARAINGVATFPGIALNRVGSGYTLSASTPTPGITAATSTTFAISAGAPAVLAVITDPSSTSSLSPIAPPVVIEIRDAAGNPVTSATNPVTLAITAGSGTAGATLGGTRTVSAIGGLTTFSTLTVDRVGTGYRLDATAPGLASVTTAPFVIGAGVPASLFFIAPPPATATSLSPFSTTVQIRDAIGNVVTSATDTVTLSINTGPGGGALAGLVKVAASGGVATFPSVTLDKAGAYTINATRTGTPPATSGSIALQPGAPAVLAVITDPSSTSSLSPIAPPVVIAILDAAGNAVTSATNPVTLAITAGSGTAGAALGGTRTVNAIGGLATFSTLTVDRVGTGYRLDATAAGLASVTTAPFVIGAGVPATLFFIAPPPATATSLSPFSTTVQIRDARGNLVTSATDTVTLSINTGPGGGALAGLVKVAASGGVATFPSVTLDKAGAYTINATRTGTPSATSGSIALQPGAPVSLQFVVSPSSTGSAGVSIPGQPIVFVADAALNTVTSATGTVTATYVGPATVTAGATATISSGVAAFTSLAIGGIVSAGTLTFSDGTRTTPGASFTLLAGPPSAVLADSGNAQTGNPSASLGASLVARVLDAFSNPVSGVPVSFAVNAGGGSLGAPSGVSDANGRARTSWTLGGGFGGNSVDATATGVGVPVPFGAFAVPVGTTATWVGTSSTNWTTALNWSPALVPTAASNVFVPSGTTFAPVLTAAQSTLDMTVMPAVPFNLGAFNLTVNGNFDGGTAMLAAGGQVLMAGSARTIVGQNLPGVIVNNVTVVGGRTTLAGTLSIAAGSLNVNGRTLVVAGTFGTSGLGVLVMQNPLDSLLVAGAVSFAGNSTSGLLTAGTLLVQGPSFAQASPTSPNAFAASGNHTTVFTAAGGTSVSFAAPTASRFQHLTIASGAVTFGSSAAIGGDATLQGAAGTVLAPGSTDTVTVAGNLVDPSGTAKWQVGRTKLTRSGVTVLPTLMGVTGNSIEIATAGALALNTPVRIAGNVRVTTGALEILAATDTIDGFFDTALSGALRMATAGGGLLLSRSATFAGGSTASQLTNGILALGGNLTQTTTNNAFAPSGLHETVFVGAGVQVVNFASTTGSFFANLTAASGGTVTLPSGTLVNGNMAAFSAVVGPLVTIGGDLTDALPAGSPFWQVGTTQFTRNGSVNLPTLIGSSSTIIATAGTFSPTGRVRFAGTLSVTTGAFNVGAFADTVAASFATSGTGSLRMASPSSSLLVIGNASFGGGTTGGQLSAGTLRVRGNFVQNTTSTAFAPTAAHVTRLEGTVAQTVNFANPAATTGSSFASLVTRNAAGVVFNTNVVITGAMIDSVGTVTGAAVTATLNGSLFDSTATRAVPAPSWQVGTTRFTAGAVTALPPVMTSTNVQFASLSSFTMANGVQFNGTGGVDVQAGTLDLNGLNSTVAGNFSTTGTGVLRMASGTPNLLIQGNALFSGGSTSGALVAGQIRFAGNLTQSGGPSTYDATATHTSNLLGVATQQTVSIASPSTSRLGSFVTSGTFNKVFATDATILGNVGITGTGLITGLNRMITVGGDMGDAGVLWDPDSTTFTKGGTLTLPATVNAITTFANLSSASLVTNTTFASDVYVTSGSLDVAAAQVVLNANFTTTGTGSLRMTNAAGTFRVKGNALFNGASTASNLTNGKLFLEGNLTQGGASAQSFAASNAHLTRFEPPLVTPIITFANPGNPSTLSGFGNLSFANARGANFATAAFVAGTDSVIGAGNNITSTPGRAITLNATGAVTALVDASARWRPDTTILGGSGAIPASTFGTYLVAAARSLAANWNHTGNLDLAQQLTVSLRTLRVSGRLQTIGASGTLRETAVGDSVDVDSVTFQGADQTTHLTGGVLLVRGNFRQAATNSTTSYVSSGTHTTILAPGTPAGLSMATGDSLNSRFQNVVYSTVATSTIAVAGQVFIAGTLTGSGSGPGIIGSPTAQIFVRGALSMSGITALGTSLNKFRAIGIGAGTASFATVGAQADTLVYFNTPFTAGTFPSLIGFQSLRLGNTTLAAQHASVGGGPLSITGDLSIVGVNARFKPNRAWNVAGNFVTDSGAVLVMTAASDSLSVTGNATFRGGSTAGLLTSGNLSIAGDFTQIAATSPRSFVSSTGHITRLSGTSGNQNITFATPDTTFTNVGSSFARLVHGVGSISTLVLQSSVAVTDSVSFAPTTGRFANGAGSVRTLFTRGMNISNTAFTQVRIVFNRPGIAASGAQSGNSFIGPYGSNDVVTVLGNSIASLPVLTWSFMTFSATGQTAGCFVRATNSLAMTVTLTFSSPVGASAFKTGCGAAPVTLNFP